MSADDSVLRTVLIVIAVLLAIPLLMMTIMIPTMGLAGWGYMSTGTFGWGSVLLTAIPLVILLGVGYVLYIRTTGGDDRKTNGALEELRSAYARGELSDEEFENRRDRLQRE